MPPKNFTKPNQPNKTMKPTKTTMSKAMPKSMPPKAPAKGTGEKKTWGAAHRDSLKSK
jgi:hypothetical protein